MDKIAVEPPAGAGGSARNNPTSCGLRRFTSPAGVGRFQVAGLITALFLAIAATAAASGDDILGFWNDEEKIVKIEIYRCGGKYCGKLVWLKEPNYPEGSKEGTPGTPRLDHNNPVPALRKTPLFGLTIMRDFTHAGGNVWTGGRVYDPKNGKTYRGKVTLVSPHQLDLRGFIGIPLFGRTTTWTR